MAEVHETEHCNIENVHLDIFKCDICNMTTDSMEKLNSHVNTEHLKFKCDDCEFVAATKNEVTEHKRTAHEENCNKTFKCDICDFAAETENGVGDHMKSKHKNNVAMALGA